MRFYLVLLLVTAQCNAQKMNKTAGEKFLRWIASKSEEPLVAKQPAKLYGGMLAYLTEIGFSRQDSLKMILQIQESLIDFPNDLFVGKTLLDEAEEKAQYKQVVFLFAKFSRPVFFDKKVWIYIEHFCGNNCGSGEIRVYSIDKSGYTLLLNKEVWIS